MVDLARVFESVTGGDGADDLDGLAGPEHGLIEAYPRLTKTASEPVGMSVIRPCRFHDGTLEGIVCGRNYAADLTPANDSAIS